MAYAAPLMRSGRQNGTVRVSSLLGGVDAELERLAVQYGLLGLGILVLAVTAGALLSGTIVRPVRRVTKAASALGAGDLTVRAQVRQRDETGQLAAAFNRMAGDLERAQRLKNEFISQISHELRTPLTSIQGWAETVRGSDPSEWSAVEHGLGIISTEAQRLSTLVEELLDFSRLQAGAFELRIEQAELSGICREVCELFLPRAQRQGVALTFEGQEVTAEADTGRIKQILINLVDNAVKHTPKGGSITVKCLKLNDSAQISVTDTGEGIAEDVLPKVTELFFRGTKNGRGTGLGLAICQRLAALHGGSLHIESEPKKGTAVMLTLPIKQPDYNSEGEN